MFFQSSYPSVLGYYISNWLGIINPNLRIPEFASALIVAYVVQLILRVTDAHEYVDRSTVNRISGAATDFLIVAGMESIKFSVVVKYAVPLTILFVFGFLLNWFWFMRFTTNMARRKFL
ncbi:sodium/glutamate symporter [Acetomicrobium sp.]|uniref:sodium/glutamate symporter n=1 Tax=Acetomicrobium sp. TaxID=1872099 RepID=UPI002FCAF0F7